MADPLEASPQGETCEKCARNPAIGHFFLLGRIAALCPLCCHAEAGAAPPAATSSGNRLSAEVRAAVIHARLCAGPSGDTHADSHHLLAALSRLPAGRRALAQLELSEQAVDELAADLAEIVAAPSGLSEPAPLTPRARALLYDAWLRAQDAGADQVSLFHLVSALANEPVGIAATLLATSEVPVSAGVSTAGPEPRTVSLGRAGASCRRRPYRSGCSWKPRSRRGGADFQWDD